jgi:hypothetical protein
MNDDVKEVVQKSVESAAYFNEYIFPYSYEEKIVNAPHTHKWIQDLQEHTHVAILSARRHLKSTTIYSYLMWRLFTNPATDYEVIYISFQEQMAAYHTAKLKKLINRNPFFKEYKDETPAESILKYTTDGQHYFTVKPAGMLGFKRGAHCEEILCDDVLADPANELNLTVIEKINRTFFEEVMSLPKETGNGIKLVGTAQVETDLFFQIQKKTPRFKWGMYKAIKDYKTREVLWPEMFPYERLIEIRDQELGERAFNKEMMCSPVHSENAYFNRTIIERLVDTKTQPVKCIDRKDKKGLIYLGWDIGKKQHPSHVSIYQMTTKNNKPYYTQIQSLWMDNMDYTRQLRIVSELCQKLGVDEGYWDATRGEFDSFNEQGLMPDMLKPMIFQRKTKFDMATVFERIVNEERVSFLEDERQVSQIVSVNSDLEAAETSTGHGDSFWSNALALFASEHPGLMMSWSKETPRY